MRDEHMVDEGQLTEREIRHSGTRVYQDVVVDQHRGGAQVTPPYSSAASKNLEFHYIAALIRLSARLLLVEGGNPVPIRGRRRATPVRHPFRV